MKEGFFYEKPSQLRGKVVGEIFSFIYGKSENVEVTEINANQQFIDADHGNQQSEEKKSFLVLLNRVMKQ